MPFNQILGTEANVRVLRVLADRRVPISAAELARQTQLQRSTISRTLKQLDQLGVIDFTGVAPQAQALLREPGMLARAIRQLFQQERARFDGLLADLHKSASEGRVVSAWLGRSIGLGIDRAGDPVQVFVLDKPDRVAGTAEKLRQSLERLERKFDVTFDVNEVTMADLGISISSEELEGTTLLAGLPPGGLIKRPGTTRPVRRRISAHSAHDATSLKRGRRIAEAIQRDPSIIDDARAYVERRLRIASPGEKRELNEWRRILTSSPASIRKILTDPGARATRLRQTLPFFTKSAAE